MSMGLVNRMQKVTGRVWATFAGCAHEVPVFLLSATRNVLEINCPYPAHVGDDVVLRMVTDQGESEIFPGVISDSERGSVMVKLADHGVYPGGSRLSPENSGFS